jgi:pSer/pThr/pTyr-binding forkhead associated (FHA) protein
MYKYSCRKCPIRNRCIDESSNADSIKVMIRRAFEARTDTLATWGRLQHNCLLIAAEKEQRKTKTSPLTMRLKEARGRQEDEDDDAGVADNKKGSIRRLRQPISKEQQSPDYLQPVPSTHKPAGRQLKRLSNTKPKLATGPQLHWLTIVSSEQERRITLPNDGGMVLGRFDPNVGIPPDIDLTYEDRNIHLISRRHASIFAENGKHVIEDLGSKSGVFLNGEKIDYGPSRPIETGDSVWLGRIKFVYQEVPADFLRLARTNKVRHLLRITASGRTIRLKVNQNMFIGRSDPRVSYMPDIDLSAEGEASRLVSRRHALIQWRFGQPYLEDLGSGFGTRLRGDLLTLGQATPMVPGDHIWLAGCVLAYDVEILDDA